MVRNSPKSGAREISRNRPISTSILHHLRADVCSSDAANDFGKKDPPLRDPDSRWSTCPACSWTSITVSLDWPGKRKSTTALLLVR